MLEWEQEFSNKEEDKNKLSSELLYTKNRTDELLRQIDILTTEIDKLKTEYHGK
jgi:chromosome segregation ATPase